MASQAQRDGANGTRPVSNGSALSIRTAGGTELAFNDAWTARIVVTAVSGAGVYLVKNLVTFLRENPELVRSAIQQAFQVWGEVKDIKPGSVIVELDCGSQEKYSKFHNDFDDGKVKGALEEEFCKIGYNEKLQMALKKRDVAVVEMSKESVVRMTKKITFVNPNPEVKGDPQEADNPNKEDFQSPFQKRKEGSHSTEVKQEEESGSADKKPKLDPVREPGTSGVSSTSKTMKEVKGDPQGADNPNKEDFQSPFQKRKEGSHSTEVKQEEESGSAAKKPKLDPVREPGTSGVSSTSKTMKEGIVTDDDLQRLGKAIGSKWDRLGRRLPGIEEEDIEDIEERYKALSQKGYHILKLWKTNNGETAYYKTLHDALVDELVKRKDLAEKYCFEK